MSDYKKLCEELCKPCYLQRGILLEAKEELESLQAESAEKERHITDLQSEIVRIHGRVRELEIENDELLEDRARLQAELNAAVSDLEYLRSCETCSHSRHTDSDDDNCDIFQNGCKWEWRGARGGVEHSEKGMQDEAQG